MVFDERVRNFWAGLGFGGGQYLTKEDTEIKIIRREF